MSAREMYVDGLEDTIATLTAENAALKKELATARQVGSASFEALTARVKELEGGIHLAGWWCVFCRTFNSSEKEQLRSCRHCDRSRFAEVEAVAKEGVA